MLGVIPSCFSAVTGEAWVSLVAVVKQPQRRFIETVAREPQGPSWPRCMRGAEARHVASARPELWFAVCSLSEPLE